ncbi:peroxiredoxin-6-like [Pelobates fuscus]|uniref:peroxiredoxin-6-like n=1 Tax=Pelobates fuscus TaxID=191477 RepID=UPI002FE45B85
MSCLLLQDKFPDFKAETTKGELSIHEYFGTSWGILLSHPGDFTPVCTTELARMVKLFSEFEKRNVKLIAISLDSKDNSLKWIKDINTFGGYDPNAPLPYPIIADEDRSIAVKLGMVRPGAVSTPGLPLTARHVFVVDPKKILRLVLIYPASTGRYFPEIFRAIDSLQLTEKYGVSTEADWKPNGRVVVPEGFPPEKAAELFPDGVKIEQFPSGKTYLQFGEMRKCQNKIITS